MRFQMSPHVAGQPRFVRDQEVEAELIVRQPHSEEASVDHGDALEGHLGQSPGHVQIIQDACRVARFQEDEPAVVFGDIPGAIGDHCRYE
jgi:hypothetical protein